MDDVLFRRALEEDAPDIQRLIEASIRVLGGKYYNPKEVESSLIHLFGVDSTMIRDGTYFVAVVDQKVVGSGGWSYRLTPFGGDQATDVRNAAFRDPLKDPAIIRAMYVHPEWARRNIGQRIIRACEQAARVAGFAKMELVATLSGVDFYLKQGYAQQERVDIPLPDGAVIGAYRMTKQATDITSG